MVKTHYIQQPYSGKTTGLIKEVRKDDLIILPRSNHPNPYYDYMERNKGFQASVIQLSETSPAIRDYIGGKYKHCQGKRVLVDDFLSFNTNQLVAFWELITAYSIQEVIAWSTPKKTFSKEVFIASKTVKYWNEEELKEWLTIASLAELRRKCQELHDYMLIDAKVEKVLKIMSTSEQVDKCGSLGQEQYDLVYRLRLFV